MASNHGYELGVLPAQGQEQDPDKVRLENLDRKPALDRFFVGVFGVMGLASTVVISWQNQLLLFPTALALGGTAGFFWTSVAVLLGLGLMYMTFGEKEARWPVAAGQYFWVARMSPSRWAAPLSFISGWNCAWGWQTFETAGVQLIGNLVASIVYLWLEFSHPWFGPVLSSVVALLIVLLNLFCTPLLARLERWLLLLHIATALLTMLTLPLCQRLMNSAPMNSAGAVFTHFANDNQWSPPGLGTVLASLVPISSSIGFDCVFHLSEEVKKAHEKVPQGLMIATALNFGFDLIIPVVIGFCVPDVDAVLQTSLSSSTALGPVLQLFLTATGSRALTTVMATLLALTLLASCTNSMASASRQLWSFATDGGFPSGISEWLGEARLYNKEAAGVRIPKHAIIASAILPVFLPLVGIGSSVAVEAVVSLAALTLLVSYGLVTFTSLTYRLRGHDFDDTGVGLPHIAGMMTDGFLTIFVFFGAIIVCFPTNPHPTLTEINYAPIMFASSLFIGLVYYGVWGRHVYKCPKAIERELEVAT